MKILVIALSGIGDALMFTPSLVKLREKFPNAEIDALVMFKGVKDIYDELPQISNVHYWDFLNRKKINSLIYVLKLRKNYDVTINIYPSNRKEYNLISWIIGAKKRAAIRYLRKDFSSLGFLNNIRITENDTLHNVEENIRLCSKIIGEKLEDIPQLQSLCDNSKMSFRRNEVTEKSKQKLRFLHRNPPWRRGRSEGIPYGKMTITIFTQPLQLVFNKEDLSYAQEFLDEKKISNNDFVVGIHPGCSTLKNHDKRRWEADKFAQLGNKLFEKHNAKILIFGGLEEQILKDLIATKIQSGSAWTVNTSSLSNTAAIMKRCDIFVSNDSSLMHVAAALKLNVVAILGPTNKNYIFPWQTNYKIASLELDCSPCFYYSPKPLTCTRTDVKFKCIKELSADLVYEKAKELVDSC